jgi:DNA invertase Pin-like site-specific DNA recombinase
VLEELQSGNTRIVAELSRLGRSMLECMEILALAMRKGILVYAVKGSWQLDQSNQNKIIRRWGYSDAGPSLRIEGFLNSSLSGVSLNSTR